MITGKNFECPDSACSKLVVKFGVEENGVVMPATLQSSSKILVDVPAYTKPDVLPISISFNGIDYTRSELSYGYFDPFIIRVTPKLLPYDRKSKLTIHGFGYINPENSQDIRVKFTSPKGELTCQDKSPCIVPAQFVNKTTITC